MTNTPPPLTDPTLEDLQAVLDRRAKALTDGDEQAFLAPLDQANRDLIQRERLRFANLTQLEFRNFGFVTDSAYAPIAVDHANGVFEYSPVIQLTQLAIDDAPSGVAPAESFQYVVAAKDGELMITDVVAITLAVDEQLKARPGVYANAPWNTTPLTVLRAGHVWLAGDDSVLDLEDYAAPAEAEARTVEALWGDRTRFPGYLLFFSRDTANLQAWFDAAEVSPVAVEHTEGLQVPLQGVRTNGQVYPGQYAGARIVVNLASTELAGDDPRAVIRHELAHAVTARAAAVPSSWGALDVPRWALEGFARWVETIDSPDRQARQRAVVADGVRAGKFSGLRGLSGPEEFYGADISFNYAVSASVFGFIEQTAGRDTAVEFYAGVIQYHGAPITLPGTDPSAVLDDGLGEIYQQILGTDRATFQERWAAFLRRGA